MGVEMLPFLLLLSTAAADTLQRCHVSVGEVLWCMGTAFTGNTPVQLASGHVYSCDVVVGQVTACFLPFTGSVVLPRGSGGKHVSCTVNQGLISRCDATGFNGVTILPRP